jgi:hypothetical protein
MSPDGFYLGGAVSVLFAVFLGVRGHALAWRSRRFKNLHHFRETMESWNTVGIIAFALKVLAFIFFAWVYLSGLANPR